MLKWIKLGPAKRAARRLTALAGMAGALALSSAGPASAAYDWTAVYNAMDASPFQHGAIVIYHKGNEVYRKGFGWWSAKTPTELANLPSINVASLSKTYTAMIAMSVMDDPNVNLDLDDLVKTYVPNANTLHPYKSDGVNFNYDLMTVRHLMSMTAGQDYFTPFPTNLLTCVNNNLFSFNTCGENMVKRQLQAGPGTKFAYSSAPWQILGLVLVRAVNQGYGVNLDFEGVVAKYLTGSGACNLAKTRITPNNNEWPAGGFENDLIDGGKLAQAMLSRTCGSGHTIMSATARAQMELDHMHDYYAVCSDAPGSTDPCDASDYVFNPAPDNRGYGLGLFLNNQTKLTNGTPTTSPNENVWLGVGAWGATLFYSPDGQWAAYLHLDDHLLSGVPDSITLTEQLIPLIDAQAAANP